MSHPPQNLLKLLRADFFKQRGFSTKTSGVEFVNKRPKIIEKMNEMEETITAFQEDTIDEFGTYFDENYENEIKIHVLNDKEERKRALLRKKDLEKEAMKETIIKEYLAEQEKKKNEEKIKDEIKDDVVNQNDSRKSLSDLLPVFSKKFSSGIDEFRIKMNEKKIILDIDDEKQLNKYQDELKNMAVRYLEISRSIMKLDEKYN